MRLSGFLAALVFIAGATAGANAQITPAMMMKPKITAFYLCNGLHFKAVYDNRPKYNRVSFVWGAKDYHLPRVDKMNYLGHGLEWTPMGTNATLYAMPEHTMLTSCTPGKRF